MSQVYKWSFEFRDEEEVLIPQKAISLNERPNIDIEELETNFLSKKTWIPGRATWKGITIHCDDELKEAKGIVIIKLWNGADDNPHLIETWTLEGAKITKKGKNEWLIDYATLNYQHS